MPHVCPGSRDLSSSLSLLLANAPTPQSGSAIWPQATAAPRRILLMRGRRLFGVLFPFSPKPRCISGLSCWLQAKLICMCDPKGLLQGPGGRPAWPGPVRPGLGLAPGLSPQGGDVVRGAAEGLGGHPVPHVLLAHAKVGDLHVALRVQHHVVEFQVAVGWTQEFGDFIRCC